MGQGVRKKDKKSKQASGSDSIGLQCRGQQDRVRETVYPSRAAIIRTSSFHSAHAAPEMESDGSASHPGCLALYGGRTGRLVVALRRESLSGPSRCGYLVRSCKSNWVPQPPCEMVRSYSLRLLQIFLQRTVNNQSVTP